MARFLFCVYGASGHVHPTLPVARALKQRGHEVGLLSSGKFAPAACDLGLTYFAPSAWDATLDRIKPEPPARSARESFERTREKLRTIFFKDAPLQACDVRAVAARWPVDVLVSSDMTFGVSLVAEAEGIPWATHAAFLTCPLPSRDLPPWGMGIGLPRTPWERFRAGLLSRLVRSATRSVSREWDVLRAAQQLPRRGLPLAECLMSPFLYTLPSAAAYDFPRTDLPPHVHYVGPCLWNETAENASWESPFAGQRPLVYCTAGTLYNELGFARIAIEAAKEQDFDLFITVGKNNDPHVLDPLPTNVRAGRYVPQHLVLPHVAAVLCTGGSGVVMGSLLAGKPLVVVPQMSDQPENARRCVHAGVAEALLARACSPEALRAALRRVLAQPSFAQAAQRMSTTLSIQDGPGKAARLLEQLARTGRPVYDVH